MHTAAAPEETAHGHEEDGARADAGRTSCVEAARCRPRPTKVKVAVTDIDGVLRGKYLHKDKFASAVDGGFGFCDVVFGWDMMDSVYDNTTVTGWQHGFPDAMVRLDLATGRRVPWDDHVPFFLGEFVTAKGEPYPICPAPDAKRVLEARREARRAGHVRAGVRVVQLRRNAL